MDIGLLIHLNKCVNQVLKHSVYVFINVNILGTKQSYYLNALLPPEVWKRVTK